MSENVVLPSGKHTKSYGKSPSFNGHLRHFAPKRMGYPIFRQTHCSTRQNAESEDIKNDDFRECNQLKYPESVGEVNHQLMIHTSHPSCPLSLRCCTFLVDAIGIQQEIGIQP